MATLVKGHLDKQRNLSHHVKNDIRTNFRGNTLPLKRHTPCCSCDRGESPRQKEIQQNTSKVMDPRRRALPRCSPQADEELTKKILTLQLLIIQEQRPLHFKNSELDTRRTRTPFAVPSE